LKVILVAKGMGWKDAPLEGEIWGICQWIKGRPANRIIDMNDYSLWGDFEAQMDKLSRRKAKDKGIPYYDLSNYPLDKIIEFFGVDYFSSTVDFAIALAIYEGFTEIDMYGVNMQNETEYAYQKAGADFWVGQALGRGIKVQIFGKFTSLLKTRDGLIYGYGTKQKGLI
jgi:hypothetical protein